MKLGVSFLMIQVIFLLVLQGCAIIVLWSLNPLSQSTTDAFALFLSIDILAFAVMSYLYRSFRSHARPSEGWLSLGYLALAVLIVSILVTV